jgi:hypothetical protein
MPQFRAPLEASLNEDLRMAQWLGDNIPEVTRRYLAEVEGGRPANSAFLTRNLGAIVREHKPPLWSGPLVGASALRRSRGAGKSNSHAHSFSGS